MKNVMKLFMMLGLTLSLFGQGRIFVPVDRSVKLEVKTVDAGITVKNGLANVFVSQSFYNSSSRQVEGIYIFPIPKGAEIHNFGFLMNGSMVQGKVLDSEAARLEYERIVRTMRDPALLEYSGGDLYKARVFPILPKSETKIELTYAHVLPQKDNHYKFVLPIHAIGQAQIQKYHISLDLSDQGSLGNIYSPSHKITVKRISSNRASISFEGDNLDANKDFVLIYSIDDRAISASFLSFRPRTDRDGYFMWMATPKFGLDSKKTIAKDIIFVIDVSGSMGGQKIVQAKESLKFCLNQLNPDDRFEIINFSSTINNFTGRMLEANIENIKNALYFAEQMNASGGTNIYSALNTALRLKKKSDSRPTNIIFLTDGIPTEGDTNIKNIIASVNNENSVNMRVFSFGVGYDVNTFLLDKLALDTHGSTDYIKPGEPLEEKISSFFAKIADPVLARPELKFTGIEVYDIFSQQLPDIFKGQRIMVFGRYRKAGSGEVSLSGKQDGLTRRFSYNIELPERESENDFIGKLWANRKVAHLLSQIRFNGETPELVQSVKNIGIEFGIVTPYTSYLVTEQEKELAALPATASGIRLQAAEKRRNAAGDEVLGSISYNAAVSKMYKKADAAKGQGAVRSSAATKQMAESEEADDMLLTSKQVGGRSFYLKNGIWVETTLDSTNKADIEVEFLSDAYFDLVSEDPLLAKILAIGDAVKFKWKGDVYLIK